MAAGGIDALSLEVSEKIVLSCGPAMRAPISKCAG